VKRFFVDEAHCVLWGSFRNNFQLLYQLKLEFADVPVVALTATASKSI
jgi:superfamily II DNA helicase RecQ